MAGFTTLALGLAIGSIAGSVAARKRKKAAAAPPTAPVPGADVDLTTPDPPSANKATSDAIARGRVISDRMRKRLPRGTGPRPSGVLQPRPRVGVAQPAVRPRALTGSLKY